jgi:penicillin-binding protein 1A
VKFKVIMANEQKRETDIVGSIIKISLAVIIVLSAILVVLGVLFYGYITQNIPSIDALRNYAPSTVSKFYADDGELIGEFFTEKREVVSLDRLPAQLIHAFVAGEDSRFFQHKGLDYVAILRAFFRNLFSGEIVQGGSTITQQVVKSLLLTPERSLERKVREAILAFKIEKYLSKEEILYLYLNQIYLGHGAYGVAVAADNYFDKKVEDLNLAECALLAGLVQAPSKTSPFQHPELAKRRQVYVLNRMAEEGFISSAEMTRALQTPIKLVDKPLTIQERAPYFVQHVRKYIEEKYGKDALLKKGLKVYTTVDLGIQKIGEETVEAGLKEIEKRHKYSSPEGPSPSLEGALISFDLETGYVKAMVGGRDFRKSQFNRATQARRQTGSAFKPIVYAAALDKGYTAASVLVDAPVVFEWGDKKWRPKNYGEKYWGPITVRTALTHSVNVVTVKIAQDIGVEYIRSYAQNLGISSPLNNDLSMALGSSGISLYELAKTYAVFANQGRSFSPIVVKKVLDRDGNLLEENPPLFLHEESSRGEQVIAPQTAYLVTNLLESVVQDGTGARAKALRRPVAGKTGTTDQFLDAWFMGYTPEVLTGVWVGFDDERSLGENEAGSRAALPIWLGFMSRVLREKPAKDFPIPEGIEFMKIDPRTGDLSSDGDAILECFKEGTGPDQAFQARSAASTDFFKLDFNLSSQGR